MIDSARGVVTALQDVTFDLREGDRLGLIGHNGAGKSTMLRLLAGCYPPTRGRIHVDGRISTLFNTTPGLSLNGTGRENVLICGLHLGLTRAQIAARMDEIIDFAELGDYIDLPVRIYSSGMLTRLAFAIATSVDPEILLLDEGLATGDAKFAHRAEKRMSELVTRSSILVIASHSEALIANMCTRCVMLEHGRIVAEGSADTLVENYRNAVIEAARADDQHGLRQAYVLANDMAKRGELPPPELEEQGLRYALQLQPDDIAMWQRLGKVITTQGKPLPADIEMRLLIATLQNDPSRADIAGRLDVLIRESDSNIPLKMRDEAKALLRA
jgi:ABC-2 type transport system ATP-binding protein/lipopolysaccharide transport system ATP-binding protein